MMKITQILNVSPVAADFSNFLYSCQVFLKKSTETDVNLKKKENILISVLY